MNIASDLMSVLPFHMFDDVPQCICRQFLASRLLFTAEDDEYLVKVYFSCHSLFKYMLDYIHLHTTICKDLTPFDLG